MQNNQQKKQLEEIMKKYVNNNGCIDISAFRNEHPNEYPLISYYFGGIDAAIEKFGWVKVAKTKGKKGQTVTLRNRLAYNMIKEMRKNMTLEEIARQYGVSKPAVNQLFQALESSIEA